VALADGYRESAESWAGLLRDCARRGMRAPVLALPIPGVCPYGR
jgi:putative transposase